jgi:aconitate decarboxylase
MTVTTAESLDPAPGPTTQLCEWAATLQRENIPETIISRAKYLILDGITCAMVGAKVPWSEKYVQATLDFEPPGYCSIIGHDQVRLLEFILIFSFLCLTVIPS